MCLLVHELPPLPPASVARCVRCAARIARTTESDANARAWHAACAALILYPFAIALPILRLERLGEARESSVWSGSLGLISEGELAVGLLVFVCSVVVPLLKLGTLVVFLRWPGLLGGAQRARAWRFLELSGRWGMLDVLLVSVLVAWLELGAWVEVRAGPAAAAFGACVVCSLLASAWLDPHALGEDDSLASPS